jgi:hypothetical protein
MSELTVHGLLLNVVLIVVTMFALAWRQSRPARHAAASRELPRPRSVPRSALARTRDASGRQTVVSAGRKAS